MPNPHNKPPTQVYAAAYHTYWQAGWAGILPIPPATKKITLTGYTGNHGTWPSYPDLHAWAEDQPHANIALRLPETIIGIDIDAYDGKNGHTTLAALENTWGPLPPTWRSTSRDDGTSGIRLYRAPAGLRWPSIAGASIEIIRHAHRYAIVWPSIHPEGRTYRWINPHGHVTIGEVPTPDDLPLLPTTWIDGLTQGRQAGETGPRADLTDTQARQWLTARPQGAPCRAVEHVATRRGQDLLAPGATRHDVMLEATQRLAHLAAEGHQGVPQALNTLRDTFLAQVGTDGSRAHGEAEQEWNRALAGAIRNAAPNTTDGPDPCTNPLHGLIDRSTTPWPTTPTPETAPEETTTNASTSSAPASNATTAPNAPNPDRPPQGSHDAPATATGEQPTLDPEQVHYYYLQEVARIQGRTGAQRWFDEHHRDEVIADRIRRRELDETANHEWRKQAQGAQDPPEPVTLTHLLAQEDDPVRYRVADLWPVGGRVVLAAPAKAGKSTAVTNLVRSLADHMPYLGRFTVHPPQGRIVVIDNELDPRQIRANYRAQGITNTDQIEIIPLRGRVGTFDILNPTTRAEWSEKLQEMGASVVIFDCLRPLIDSLGLSEDKDAGRILVAFDALLNDAGVEDGLVVHHMGHSGERSRGDTRIRDWPDAEWKIVKQATEEDENDDQAPRFFSAFGRDVYVAESQLSLDYTTRTLTISGGSRAQAKLQPALDAIIGLLRGHPNGLSSRQVELKFEGGDHGRNEIRKALKLASQMGLTRIEAGAQNANLHVINNPSSPPFATSSPPPSGERSEPVRQSPRKGAGAGELERPNDSEPRRSPGGELCTKCGALLDPTLQHLISECPQCQRNRPGPDWRLDYSIGEYVHRTTGEIWDPESSTP